MLNKSIYFLMNGLQLFLGNTNLLLSYMLVKLLVHKNGLTINTSMPQPRIIFLWFS
ncbi:hypothetical protein HanIR_Chr03g0137171 [Helianthus annuus]|nr:hypothetical protein HanIR_Chr03g0137171 [Helianthus annuus]